MSVLNTTTLKPATESACDPACNGDCGSHTHDQAVVLTRREVEILRLAALGKTSKVIAAEEFVSKRTVDFHLAHVYIKMGVTNRMQAFRRGVQLGIIPIDIQPAALQSPG